MPSLLSFVSLIPHHVISFTVFSLSLLRFPLSFSTNIFPWSPKLVLLDLSLRVFLCLMIDVLSPSFDSSSVLSCIIFFFALVLVSLPSLIQVSFVHDCMCFPVSASASFIYAYFLVSMLVSLCSYVPPCNCMSFCV